jgi:hypothetical protein
MMRMALRAAALGAVVLAGLASEVRAGGQTLSDWSTVQSTRYGFSLTFPGSVFDASTGQQREEGIAVVSRDGLARLAVATFENEANVSLADYRRLILNDNYAGATIEYGPMRNSWFVVSGTRGNMHFYERVSFTCQGRLINSWALLYPVAQKALYDRVVEMVARSYSPGEGRSGRCD